MSRITDDRDLGAFIPSFLDDYGLRADEFRLYARLARRAGNGKAFESVPHMAKGCGLSDRQVRYGLRLFEAAGMVKPHTRRGRSTIYSLTGGSKWVDAGKLAEIRLRVRKGDPSKKPVHHAAPTPAPDAGDPCTPCSPTPAPCAGQQTPAHHAAKGISEANKDNHEGGCGCPDAENKNQPQAQEIEWPENLIDQSESLLPIISKIEKKYQQDFVDELAAVVAEEKVKTSVAAYACGMVKNKWQPRREVQDDARSAEIEKQIVEIRRAVGEGKKLFVDGHSVEFATGNLIRFREGNMPLGEIIKQGMQIETRREAA